VFQIPIAEEFGWARAEFSLAIAIQNLAWGIGQPLFGAMAERFGDRKAIIWGRCFMRLGLVLSSFAVRPGSIRRWKSWSASASRAPALA
jgi:MFS family permease